MGYEQAPDTVRAPDSAAGPHKASRRREKIYETRGNFKGARRDFLLPEADGESFDTSPDLAGGSEQIPLARQPFELIRAALVESHSRD